MESDQDYFSAQGYSVPLPLTSLSINGFFRGRNARKPGNYILEKWVNGVTLGRRVGRSDKRPLKKRLSEYLDDPAGYTTFRYKLAADDIGAHDQECLDWHRFEGQLDNENHPDQLDDTTHACPHPGCKARKIEEIAEQMDE